jgi:hypothetical protein
MLVLTGKRDSRACSERGRSSKGGTSLLGAIFNDARERRDIVASIDPLYGEPCMCIDDAGWSNATCPLPVMRGRGSDGDPCGAACKASLVFGFAGIEPARTRVG